MLKSVDNEFTRRKVKGDGGGRDKPGPRSGEKPQGWDDAEGDYSPDKFYPAGSDEHGHSRVTSLRVSPVVMGMVSALAQDPQFPDIRTVSDFFRDAVIHRLWHLRHGLGADSILEADIQRELRRAEMTRIAQRVEADQRHIRATEEQLAKLAAMGDTETFEYVADLAVDLADDFTTHNLRELSKVIKQQRRVLAQHTE